MNRVFSWGSGDPYNVPLLLTTRGSQDGEDGAVWCCPTSRRARRSPWWDPGAACPATPHWALNLKADGACQIRLLRRREAVTARLAVGEERASLWASITERAPVYLEYQERAREHREIPVFVLDGATLHRRGA